jgi:formate/nitrite transporter FocA (FNT family)
MNRSSSRDDVLEHETQQIADRASDVGAERLDRTPFETLVTAVIGGGEVSIGGLAAMTIVGSLLAAAPGLNLYAALAVGGLAFPIGFLFVILGRSELFTEDFLIPVAAVVARERTLGSLILLWLIAWVGNLVGCAGTSVLLSIPEVIGEPIRSGYVAYATEKLKSAPLGVLASAVLAGGVMTALTWVLLSIEHPVARIVAIFASGYVLFAANLAHSIVSASVLMVGIIGSPDKVIDLLGWLLLATLGNLVGGVGLVTLFRIVQAREQQKS